MTKNNQLANNVVLLASRTKNQRRTCTAAIAATSCVDQTNCRDRSSVISHLEVTFQDLVRRPVDAAWCSSTDGKETELSNMPSHGPYNAFIGYFDDGTPNHSLRFVINSMKKQRKHTNNAVELRCDALGLAVYVSGITQVDAQNRVAREGVRVVVYDHNLLNHTDTYTAKSAAVLTDKLYATLVNTFNRLAREYNLAGFTSEFLTLKSSHRSIPDIRIDMQ